MAGTSGTVHASLALLLLELERDAADPGRARCVFMRSSTKPAILLRMRFDGDGDLVTNTLVRVEVDAEPE